MSTPEAGADPVIITGSRQLASWLAEVDASLAFTTYHASKIFLVGHREDGALSVFERTFPRCMGLAAAGSTLWASTLYQLWRFEDALAPGGSVERYDALYVPQVAYTTGDVDIHDVAIGTDGWPWLAVTRFSCVARPSETHSFRPVWQPPFVSRLAPEDRCHLNGVALEAGEPRYVTVLGRSDVADGWRENRAGGGCVVDVRTGEVVAAGLSMPHSPRLRGDRLWLLESGTGRLGWLDPAQGLFEPVAFCPGYLRGLAFTGRYAVVGLSRPRGDRTFSGLPLEDALTARGARARCGLQIVDLETGEQPHWLRVEGLVEEIYDVAILSGRRRPMMVGLRTDEILRTLTLET